MDETYTSQPLCGHLVSTSDDRRKAYDHELSRDPRGPVDSSRIPRYAYPATFARLPRLDEVGRAEVAVVGVPFDSGVSYRPGARFGGNAIREASRLLRPYNPAQDASPFALAQVADGGDIAVNPFDIHEAVETIEAAADDLLGTGARLMTLGGDHTIALPLLRSVAKKHGPVALLHFDAHLDTWDTYFGAEYTHGTPFRRAVEEGILDTSALSHVGTRGPLYGKQDLTDDEKMGFGIVTSADVMRRGVDEVADQLRQRIGDRPLYISIDIDCLDPAHAPGTGTPEAGGMTSASCWRSCGVWHRATWCRRTSSRWPPRTTTRRSRRWRPPTPPTN